MKIVYHTLGVVVSWTISMGIILANDVDAIAGGFILGLCVYAGMNMQQLFDELDREE